MKKLALICLALVISLGGLGVGYAMWSDTVTISGPVTTGTADVCVKDVSSNEAIPGNADPQCLIGDNSEGKDVAYVSYEIIDCDEVRFTVHNAYPYYSVISHFTVCNQGTIPVRWQQPMLTDYDPTVMTLSAWDGSQLEPGDCNDFTFQVCFLQPAQQNATYSFTIQVKYVQWNEWTAPQ